jgi:hypothetical protein
MKLLPNSHTLFKIRTPTEETYILNGEIQTKNK